MVSLTKKIAHIATVGAGMVASGVAYAEIPHRTLEQLYADLVNPKKIGLVYELPFSDVQKMPANEHLLPETLSFQKDDFTWGLTEKHRVIAHSVYEETRARGSSAASSSNESSASEGFPSTKPLFVGTNSLCGPYVLVSCNRVVSSPGMPVEDKNSFNVKNIFTEHEPATLWAGFPEPMNRAQFRLYKAGVHSPIAFDMSIGESGMRWMRPELSRGNYTAVWSYGTNTLGTLEFTVVEK